MTAPSGNFKPDNGLVGAILATIFCCQPFGIVAIVFAAQVDTAWSAGNYAAAHENAEKARKWTKVAFACGLVYVVILVIYLAGLFSLTGQGI